MKRFLLLVPDLPSFLLGVKFNNILVEMIKKKTFYNLGLHSFGGGIGRRAGFKIQFWQQSVGSIPTRSTIIKLLRTFLNNLTSFELNEKI